MNITPPPSPPPIANPCPKSWDAMTGDAKRRFCEHCQHQVHNLSAMSARERDIFLEKSGGQACIAYVLRPDGSMVTSTWRTKLAVPFRRVGYALAALLATFLPFVFSACAPRRTLGKLCPPSASHGKEPVAPETHLRIGKSPRVVVGTPMVPKKKQP